MRQSKILTRRKFLTALGATTAGVFSTQHDNALGDEMTNHGGPEHQHQTMPMDSLVDRFPRRNPDISPSSQAQVREAQRRAVHARKGLNDAWRALQLARSGGSPPML